MDADVTKDIIGHDQSSWSSKVKTKKINGLQEHEGERKRVIKKLRVILTFQLTQLAQNRNVTTKNKFSKKEYVSTN